MYTHTLNDVLIDDVWPMYGDIYSVYTYEFLYCVKEIHCCYDAITTCTQLFMGLNPCSSLVRNLS